MGKKIISIGIISAIVAVLVIVAAFSVESEPQPEIEVVVEADVIMPTKSSRPGCEETDECYIPSVITAKPGQKITWLNTDAAFHSVTSGTFDEPLDTFDSGYMDPEETFSLTFDEEGTYDYYCTLHFWMEGKVIVE